MKLKNLCGYPTNKVLKNAITVKLLEYLFRVICFNNVLERLAQKCYPYIVHGVFLSETISWMFM